MINIASNLASQNGDYDKWQFSLYKSTYLPFLKYSSKRELREKMFKAYSKLGNNNNEYDNKEVVNNIVNLRLQKAKLFGYKNYASSILKTDKRMLSSPDKVYEFLGKTSKIYFKKARKEAEELQKMMREDGQSFKLQAWDWMYYVEKYKQKYIQIDNKELKSYFELENTLKGLFSAVNKMYSLNIKERTDLPIYSYGIRVFEISEKDGKHIGIIYFSFYAGNNNTDYIKSQYYKDNKRINPILIINYNFSQDYKTGKTFLTLQQTKKLYHEFGHALHGLLSDTKHYSTSGLNVTHDFVEFPSQYMEKFSLDKENLKLNAKHYMTGEIIPDKLIDKIQKSEQFNKAFIISERLAAAYLDIKWHTITENKEYNIEIFEKEVANKIMLSPQIIPRYNSTYFSHVFSGYYASGYYGYLWTDILVEDIFKTFNKKSIFDKEKALSFRKNILEKGGSEPAIELYNVFYSF